jgi:hypothetical protein
VWHVTVLGTPPPENLHRRIEQILATGEPTALPDEILIYLLQRGVEQSKHGTWVEQHHFPRRRRIR